LSSNIGRLEIPHRDGHVGQSYRGRSLCISWLIVRTQVRRRFAPDLIPKIRRDEFGIERFIDKVVIGGT
jgi:hypothetical protein